MNQVEHFNLPTIKWFIKLECLEWCTICTATDKKASGQNWKPKYGYFIPEFIKEGGRWNYTLSSHTQKRWFIDLIEKQYNKNFRRQYWIRSLYHYCGKRFLKREKYLKDNEPSTFKFRTFVHQKTLLGEWKDRP